MPGIEQIGEFSKNLLESNDYEQNLKILLELKDSIEFGYTPNYAEFLKYIMEPCLILLRKTSPQFDQNYVNKSRNAVLEIFHRLPTTEALKRYSGQLMDISLNILKEDNEENAILALKIITDLHKGYRGAFENSVQPFLEFVIHLYSNFSQIVRVYHSTGDTNAPSSSTTMIIDPSPAFLANESGISNSAMSHVDDEQVMDGSNMASSNVNLVSSSTNNSRAQNKQLIKSTQSCKVLIECPLVVVLLFQTYQKSATANIKSLLNKIVESFEVKIDPPTNGSPEMKQKYADLISCQVKMASFLAYASRVYKNYIKIPKESIPRIVTDLILKCPNETIGIRKELLIILRHMIDPHNSELRDMFLPYIDHLLDEHALLGYSRTSYETLRPLSYSTLADLIHHVRGKLSLDQIAKTVNFYTRIMYDPTLALNIQTMSAKLLVHLVESIFKQTTSQDIRRAILINIMKAFVTKVKLLSRFIKQLKDDTEEPGNSKGETRTSLKTLPFSPYKRTETLLENVSNCRMMVKTLTLGMKNVLFVMLNMDGQQQQQQQQQQLSVVVSQLRNSAEETKLLINLFRYGLDCFYVFTIGNEPQPAEEKENMDAFSSLFTIQLPPSTFQEIMKQELPYLYSKMLENQKFIGIPTHFLASQQVANPFSDILLNFLIERMHKMAGNTNESNMLLQLFKLVFGSMVTFPNNEVILKPHLATIINNCLTYASQTKESTNYFMTIRALFRSIVSGKFDLLCKEFNPLLPVILERLTELLKGSFKSPIRDLFIELCLTVPAKLHVLCPYLPMLIRPVLHALKGNNELVAFALRNLGMWVESLRTEALEPILRPVMPELLLALFSHLKPPPYHYGSLAMKILVKLGGMNRNYLLYPSPIEINDQAEDGLKVKVKLSASETKLSSLTHEFPVDSFVMLARRILYSNTSRHTREQAFNFMKACLVSMLDLSGDLKDFKLPHSIEGYKTSKPALTILSCNNFFDAYNIEENDFPRKTQAKIQAESSLFKNLLSSMLISLADPQLTDIATDFVKGVCVHFALVSISKCNESPDPLRDLNPDLFLDALVDIFCHENSDVERSAAEQALEVFIHVLDAICDHDKEQVAKYLTWERLAFRLCHCCYQKEWFKKFGGCKGIVCLCRHLSCNWLKQHQIELVKALLFIIKDSPYQMAMFTIDEATKALEIVIRTCHTNNFWINYDTSSAMPSSPAETMKDQKKLNDLLLVLVSELSSSHAPVRKTVQSLLKLLSELYGRPISNLLEPFRGSLYNSIRVDRFDHLGMPLKTGFCEAVTFFLSLRPTFLSLTNQIVMLIEKMLAITSQKDGITKSSFALKMSCLKLLREALNCSDLKALQHAKLRGQIISIFFSYLGYHQNKDIVSIAKSGLATFISQQRLPKELLQTSLRPILSNLSSVTKLSLPVLETLAHLLELCTSYFSVKLGDQLLEHLKKWTDASKISHISKEEAPIIASRILNLFALLPPDAQKFLEQLVILTLQLETTWSEYYTEFSSPFREPLAKFLNLYPEQSLTFFLGSHNSNTDPTKEPSFVPGFIMVNTLKDAASIPQDNQYFKLFLAILKSDLTSKLRDSLARNPKRIIDCTFNLTKSEKLNLAQKLDIQLKGILIVRVLVKHIPSWITDPANQSVITELVNLWDEQVISRDKQTLGTPSIENQINTVSHGKDVIAQQERILRIRSILKCFITYCKNQKLEVMILFKMLYVFSDNSAIDVSFLRDFYEHEIVKYSPQHKKAIIEAFLKIFADPNFLKVKIEALQHLVIPALVAAFERHEEEQVLDSQLIEKIMVELFSDEISAKLDESLRVELLQLATLFVRHAPTKIVDYRKQIIKFAYNYIKSEDTTSKHCAYVLAADFIKSYDTPDKIILQVYVALLKSHQPEGKALVRSSMDTLANVLPTRLSKGSHKCPRWVYWTKKTLTDEGHSLPQLIHILQFFVRHPDLFYSSRENFVGRIVNSLTRIGTSHNHPLENRKLAIDLAELVINWEFRQKEDDENQEKEDTGSDTSVSVGSRRSRSEDNSDDTEKNAQQSANKKRRVTGENTLGSSSVDNTISTNNPDSKIIPVNELIINFLLRVVPLLYSSTHRSSSEAGNTPQQLTQRVIQLLKKALELWPQSRINFQLIQLLLHVPDPQQQQQQTAQHPSTQLTMNPELLNTGLEILKVILDFGLNHILLENIETICACFKKLLNVDHPKIIENFSLFIHTMLVTFPPSQKQISNFYDQIWEAIENGLSASEKFISAQVSQPPNLATEDRTGIYGHLMILNVLCEDSPEKAVKFTVIVHRLCNKLLREHILVTHEKVKEASAAEQQAQATPNSAPARNQNQLISQHSASNDVNVKAIEICIEYLSTFAANDSNVRKNFLTTIVAMIDKSNEINSKLILKVLREIRNLLIPGNVQDSKKPLIPPPPELTSKQKAFFISKLVILEHSPHQDIKENYYNLLLDLYQDEMLQKSEQFLVTKIESAFMCGLRSESLEVRKHFLKVLNERMQNNVFDRLNYIFQSQHWEPLSENFWIRHALDFLLHIIQVDEKISVPDITARLYPIIGKKETTSGTTSTKEKQTEKQQAEEFAKSKTNVDQMEIDECEDETSRISSPSNRGVASNTISSHDGIEILSKHQQFILSLQNMTIKDLIDPLRQLARESVRVSYDMWVIMFPFAWKCLRRPQRDYLQRPLETLLSRDYHSKQYVKYPNVIQALVEGISKCDTLDASHHISIFPEMLKFIGKSFNAWHIVIPLMENELQNMISNNLYDEKTERMCSALAELYKVLSEEDMICGIWRNHDITDQTKTVLALEQYGLWAETQEALKDIMEEFGRGQMIRKRISHIEMNLWEEHWIQCSKKLQQWDELSRYAKASQSASLSLECYWKNGDWKSMKELFARHPITESQMLKIYQIIVAIMDQQEKQSNECFLQATQLALQRWCALPSFLCSTHVNMLHNFQQLLELLDSTHLIAEVKKQQSSSSSIATSELKGFLNTWRDRLPNEYDDINMWNDILTYRYHFLMHMQKQMEQQNLDHHKGICNTGALWTQNKFAAILRKQKLLEPAQRCLYDASKISTSNNISENSEIFYRFCETVKCTIAEGKLQEALDMINGEPNAGKLKNVHKLEILKLKADVLSAMPDKKEEASKTYSMAIHQVSQDSRLFVANSTDSLGKAFLGWARLLDGMLMDKLNSIPSADSTSDETKKSAKIDTSLAEQAVICYMQAIRYWNSNKSRQHISRLIWILNLDNSGTTKIWDTSTTTASNLEKCIIDISPWVWIPWIHNLFNLVYRKIFKSVIFQIVKTYPQAIYYNLRCFYFDNRDMAKDIQSNRQQQQQKLTPRHQVGTSSPSPVQNNPVKKPNTDVNSKTPEKKPGEETSATPTATNNNIGNAKPPASTQKLSSNVSGLSGSAANNPSPFQNTNPSAHPILKIKKFAEDLMSQILHAYHPMIQDIESLLKEMSNKLRPETEEELQRALELLLRKCYKLNIYIVRNIPEDIVQFAKLIFRTYFPSDEQAQSRSNFFKEKKKQMRRDLIPKSMENEEDIDPSDQSEGPATLLELTENIKKWLHIFQERIHPLPNVLPLENLSRFLADFHSLELEIPGQYTALDREPFTEQHERMMCFLPDIDVIKRNKLSCRRVTIRSHTGILFKFLVQSIPITQNSTKARMEDRAWSLVSHLNRILMNDESGSKRRYLKLHSPTIVSLSQKIRLIHERSSYTSLEDIYHEFCLKSKMNTDTPILKFWSMLNTCEKHSAEAENKLLAYQDITSNYIPDNILSTYLANCCPSWNELFQLRKRLTTQIALYGLVTHTLDIQDRTLHKILIGKNNGELFQFDMIPASVQYRNQDQILKYEKEKEKTKQMRTPFRLTRNLQKFITPFGMEGTLLNTLTVASHSLLKNKQQVEDVVKLYVRDELQNVLLLSTMKDPLDETSANAADEWLSNLEEVIAPSLEHNVKEITQRLSELSTNIDRDSNITATTDGQQESHLSSSIPNQKIIDLIEMASNSDRISQQDPTVHPWF